MTNPPCGRVRFRTAVLVKDRPFQGREKCILIPCLAESKLSRAVGVWARRRNPERSRGNSEGPGQCIPYHADSGSSRCTVVYTLLAVRSDFPPQAILKYLSVMSSQIQPNALPLVKDVLGEILTRYVNDLQATPRKLVPQEAKRASPDLLEQLKRGYFVTARSVSTHEDSFLPTIRTFQEIADPKTLETVKKATGAVLSVLQEAFRCLG